MTYIIVHDNQFQILAVVMYVRIMNDSRLGLVEVDICNMSSLLMKWVLLSPSCCLIGDFSLSMMIVFVKNAYINLFFRSNRLISSTEKCSLHQILHPQIGNWLVLWVYYTSHSITFILIFREITGISFNTTLKVLNGIMWW